MAEKVSVIGLGKLGASMAAAFASRGFDVVGVDVNQRSVDLVNAGHAPVQETGLEEMNAANSDKFLRLCQGDLSMHGGNWSDADEALIQFFCFYTPDNNQVARLFHRSELAHE